MPPLVAKTTLRKYVEAADRHWLCTDEIAEKGASIMKAFKGGLSSHQYARKLGVTQGYVSKVLNGHTTLSPEVARRMIGEAK